MSRPRALICADCGRILTATERRYYGFRCEACERAWFDALEDWRAGASDPDLDRLFDLRSPRPH